MASTKKRVSIGLTDEQYDLVDKFAKEKGLSKSAIFVLAFERFIGRDMGKDFGKKNK